MATSISLDRLRSTAVFLARRLKGRRYAIRGTAGLVLQGLDMNVDDIDIGCDRATAMALNEVFKDYIIDPVAYSESPQFKSYFGRFKVDDVPFEVMGELRIRDSNGKWSEPLGLSPDEVTTIVVDHYPLRVTKPETELKAYALMGRWSTYHKLKRQTSSGVG